MFNSSPRDSFFTRIDFRTSSLSPGIRDGVLWPVYMMACWSRCTPGWVVARSLYVRIGLRRPKFSNSTKILNVVKIKLYAQALHVSFLQLHYDKTTDNIIVVGYIIRGRLCFQIWQQNSNYLRVMLVSARWSKMQDTWPNLKSVERRGLRHLRPWLIFSKDIRKDRNLHTWKRDLFLQTFICLDIMIEVLVDNRIGRICARYGPDSGSLSCDRR